MAKKQASNNPPKSAAASTPTAVTSPSTSSNRTATASHTPSSSVSKPATTTPTATPSLSARSSPDQIITHLWNKYLQDTPARTKLLDTFMAFLVLVGGVQFLYCVLAGNYPFNAFLSGFSAAVGQFVLTASLRMQTTEKSPAKSDAKKSGTLGGTTGTEGNNLSSERAFADFVFGSLILHAFCVNFIN